MGNIETQTSKETAWELHPVVRFKAIKRYSKLPVIRTFGTLNEALKLFYGQYWKWRVIDTQTGAEWEPY